MATYTSNYGLHQWAPEDNFLRTDFNADFLKIDAAMGNSPQIARGSYVGTGEYGDTPTRLEIGFQPKIVFIDSAGGDRFIRAQQGAKGVRVAHTNTSGHSCTLTWTSTGLEWVNTGADRATDQLNDSGTTYYWYAVS